MSIKLSLVYISLLLFSFRSYGATATFSQADFENALKSKEPFVVAFHSDSCGSCKIQKPNLETVLNEDPLKPVVGLMANFEETTEFRKKLQKSVRGPSTILIFKDGKEIGRIQGETNKDQIRSTILKSLSQE